MFSKQYAALTAIALCVIGAGMWISQQNASRSYTPTVPAPSATPLTDAQVRSRAWWADSAVGRGGDTFSVHLLQSLRADAKQNENVFVSPYSISQAVSLAANGTSGETQQKLLGAIGISGASVADVNRDSKALRALLASSEAEIEGEKKTAYEWTVANAIWSHGSPKKPYVQTCADTYGATAKPLTSAASINTWVKDKTRGRIDQIVTDDEIAADMQLLLTNAVYFKGRWVNSFYSGNTEETTFHLSSGKTRDQDFMNTEEYHMLWYAGKNYEAVSLPYQGGMSMLVLLPKQGTSATELLQSFVPEEWGALRGGLHPKWIALALPKFEIEYEASLLQPLQKMGMPLQGDFSPIADGLKNAGIVNVMHKTFLRVDEEGSEAAAVSLVGAAGGPPVPTPQQVPYPFVVDRPFLCAIVHDDTGTILFAGMINNPKPSLQPRPMPVLPR